MSNKPAKKNARSSQTIEKPENPLTEINIFDHETYIKILNAIRKDTKKIVIVQTVGHNKNDPILETAEKMMQLEDRKTVSSWLGTETDRRNAEQYTFIKKRDFFDYLGGFESFFIDVIDRNSHEFTVRYSDFDPDDDIAFTDQNGYPLFYTVTHEGMAFINRKYLPLIQNP